MTMKRNLSPAVVVALLFAAVNSTHGAEPVESGDAVKSFLTAHCVACHGPKRHEVELRLDQIDHAGGADLAVWMRVRKRVLAGEMPPDDAPQPDRAETRQFVEQVTAAVQRGGIRSLLQQAGPDRPADGNQVPHDLLFDPATTSIPATPARLWRISGHIYDELVYDLVRNRANWVQPFPTSPQTEFADYASQPALDEPTFLQLLRNAESIVAFNTVPHQITGRNPPPQAPKEFVVLMDPELKPSREQLEDAVIRQFQIVLLRTPTDDEMDKFVKLMQDNIRTAGNERGVRAALAAILMLPDVYYRSELGAGPTDEHGRQLLTPRELAFALSYALTDARPYSTLMRAVEELEDEDSLPARHASARRVAAEQTRRILDDPKIYKPRVLRFFREYFGYHYAPEVFKDEKLFRDHDPNVLVSDTDQLVLYILEQDKNVLEQLLTTRKTYVGNGVDPKRNRRRFYLSYNLQDFPAQEPVELPAGQRAGILTQPSWLVAYSTNFDNHAILRGKWIRERLLGGTVPELPITVNAQLPDEPHVTLRERMRVTHETYCYQCHRLMNPLGYPLEMFDHFGRFRTTETVVDLTAPPIQTSKNSPPEPATRQVPLDTRGTVTFSGDERLDGDVDNALQMIDRLADSPRVRQVFVRHAFRYFLGRNETLNDARVIQDADRAYVESGGSFKALVESLLSSDAFLYRVARDD